jgi:RNA polymerase sigma-70 factor (ECF subfamily)
MIRPVPHFATPTMPASPEPSDAELVANVREGIRSAFDTLVRRHQKSLYFLCLRYVRDHDTAAELTQRAFLRVFEKLTELREANAFHPWLLRIGANLAINYLRNHARFIEEHSDSNTEDSPSAHVLLEQRQTSETLHQAVARLPTKQRMTLELRIYEDLTFREIAQVLDTNEGTAKVNFHFAMRKLRAFFKPESSARRSKLHELP